MDISYVLTILDWIDADSALDGGSVYTEGFSQNSMFAAYTAYCFDDRIVGVYQGTIHILIILHIRIIRIILTVLPGSGLELTSDILKRMCMQAGLVSS